MYEELSHNLNLLMIEVHISADELARRTGVPASTIKKIRNNNNPNPTLATLLPLATYFTISLDQLVGNEPLPASRLLGQYQNIETINHVPIISWLEAIEWPKNKKNEYPEIASEFDFSKNAYSLLVEDDDWENLVKGTALLIEPQLTPEHRDFVIIYKIGQQIPSLKQILHDEDQIYLKPMIEGYTIAPLSNDHKILGVVVEYKKHLKKNYSDFCS